MRGATCMADPLACAVALASLDLLRAGARRDDVRRSEHGFMEGLAPTSHPRRVRDVRVLGAIVVERPIVVAAATNAAVNAGCGRIHSESSSTRCRPASLRTRTWPRIAAAIVAAARSGIDGRCRQSS